MNNINIILPRRERVGISSSGAVALVVKELYAKSSFRNNTKIWAGPQLESEHLYPLEIIPIPKIKYWSENRIYANRIYKRIIDSPQTYIEVHNRAKTFLLLRKRLKKTRLTLYLHNDPFEMGGLETSNKRQNILNLAEAVVCVSDFVRNRFLEGTNNFKEKCIVIHNALDMSLYSPPSEAENNIVFAGRMIKEKGVLELANALVDILPKYRNWSAIFIGGQPLLNSSSLSSYEKNLRSVLKEIENQIIWTGPLSNEAVQSYLKKSKIAVIPSIWLEPQSRFLVEAIANGCAVVTSGRGGISETIGDCGIIINPENIMDIKSGIETLINNPSLLETKRKQGYDRALKLFDVSDKIKKLDNLREGIILN